MYKMCKMIGVAATALMMTGAELKAQPIDLSFYVDANGFRAAPQNATAGLLQNDFEAATHEAHCN